MKFLLAILTLTCMTMLSYAQVTPYRVSLKNLSNDSPADQDRALIDALANVGMIAVSDLPLSFKDAMRSMTATQHECLMESKNAQEQIYPDGTVRVTLATHTVPGVGGKQALNHQTSSVAACNSFEAATEDVRETAHIVVEAFASKISALLHVKDGSFLVTEGSASNPPFFFDTFTDIVENGEHLEHFHSYKKTSKNEEVTSTIEMHTDQGLLLVFTPGRLTSGELTTGFYIRTAQETMEEVLFSDANDLILMLGDGVNQYINPKIQESNVVLRAVPHAVKLESSEYARIWYGLMVLPPAAAIHPGFGDITFGELQQKLVAGDVDSIQLACPYSDLSRNNRVLQQCASGEYYCWHMCYILSDFGVSEDICAAQSRELACISRNNQIWSGVTHGDYFPGCAGSDWEVEPVPSAPIPLTAAPVTRPPVTRPPVTRPPVSRRPVTRPPVSRRPVTRPPVSRPPISPSPLMSSPESPRPINSTPVRPVPSQTAIATSAPILLSPTKSAAPIKFIPVITSPTTGTTGKPVQVTSAPISSTTVISAPVPLANLISAPTSLTGSNSNLTNTTNSFLSPTIFRLFGSTTTPTKVPTSSQTNCSFSNLTGCAGDEEVTPSPIPAAPTTSISEMPTPIPLSPGTSIPSSSAPITSKSLTSVSTTSAPVPSMPITLAPVSSDSAIYAQVIAVAITSAIMFLVQLR